MTEEHYEPCDHPAGLYWYLVPISYELALCAVCILAMPLGLNSVVIPSAYERNTSAAAGMALVSHILSSISTPAVFMLFDIILKTAQVRPIIHIAEFKE